jgi:hypothetical protein
MDAGDYIIRRWLPRRHHPSITEKRKTTMASMDNKCKYNNDAEKEAKESTVPKNQRTNDDDTSDDGGGNSSWSSDNFLSEPKEEVSSEDEEMNLSTDSDKKLLILRACSDDADTSDSIRNYMDTSDDGSDSIESNFEEDQFFNEVFD